MMNYMPSMIYMAATIYMAFVPQSVFTANGKLSQKSHFL